MPEKPDYLKPDDFPHKEFIQKVGIVVAITALTGLFILLLLKAFNVLLLIFAGVLVACFFWGIAGLFSRGFNLNDKVSLILSVVLVLGLLTGGFFLLKERLSKQVQQVQKQLPQTWQNVKEDLKQYTWGQAILQKAQTPLQSTENQSGSGKASESSGSSKSESSGIGGNQQLLQYVSKFVKGVFGVLADLYIVIFIGIFFMATPALYKRGMLWLVPPKQRDRGSSVINAMGLTLKGWLLGRIIAMTFVAVLVSVGLWILGVPAPLALGIFAGLMDFIPNIGPLIAMIPGVLISTMEGGAKPVYVFLLYFGVQLLESNVVNPLLQHRIIRLAPAMVLIAQVLLGYLAGFLGLLLATPLFAIIMVALEMIYVEDLLKDKSIDVKPEKTLKERKEG